VDTQENIPDLAILVIILDLYLPTILDLALIQALQVTTPDLVNLVTTPDLVNLVTTLDLVNLVTTLDLDLIQATTLDLAQVTTQSQLPSQDLLVDSLESIPDLVDTRESIQDLANPITLDLTRMTTPDLAPMTTQSLLPSQGPLVDNLESILDLVDASMTMTNLVRTTTNHLNMEILQDLKTTNLQLPVITILLTITNPILVKVLNVPMTTVLQCQTI